MEAGGGHGTGPQGGRALAGQHGRCGLSHVCVTSTSVSCAEAERIGRSGKRDGDLLRAPSALTHRSIHVYKIIYVVCYM